MLSIRAVIKIVTINLVLIAAVVGLTVAVPIILVRHSMLAKDYRDRYELD